MVKAKADIFGSREAPLPLKVTRTHLTRMFRQQSLELNVPVALGLLIMKQKSFMKNGSYFKEGLSESPRLSL